MFALMVCAARCQPACADDLGPICPDRPGKGTSPCTVDRGHVQIEMDAFDATFTRTPGAAIDTYVFAAPTVKYGVSATADLEIGFSPLVVQDAQSMPGRVTGSGDLYLRGKWLLPLGEGPAAAAIEPFVKLPTASSGLGNDAVEGGLVLPFSYALTDVWSLSATPELDLLLDASGSGRHAALLNVVGIGRSLPGGVTLGAEIWTSQDLDPAGHTAQYSFDLDAAWQMRRDIQLDGGINFGLNGNTPETQVYLGYSQRF